MCQYCDKTPWEDGGPGSIVRLEGLGKIIENCPHCNPAVKTPLQERTTRCPHCDRGEIKRCSGPGYIIETCGHCGGVGWI